MLKRKSVNIALEKLNQAEAVASVIAFNLTKLKLGRSKIIEDFSASKNVCFSLYNNNKKVFSLSLPEASLPSAALELGRRIIECATKLPRGWALDVGDKDLDSNLNSLLSWPKNGVFAAFDPDVDFLSFKIKTIAQSKSKIRIPLKIGFFDKLDLKVGEALKITPVAMLLFGSTCKILIKDKNLIEVCMEKENINFPVTIDLGAIELSLEDLINLREGTKIEFELGEVVAAAIRVGESHVAKGQLKFGDGICSFQVEELLLEEAAGESFVGSGIQVESGARELTFEES